MPDNQLYKACWRHGLQLGEGYTSPCTSNSFIHISGSHNKHLRITLAIRISPAAPTPVLFHSNRCLCRFRLQMHFHRLPAAKPPAFSSGRLRNPDLHLFLPTRTHNPVFQLPRPGMGMVQQKSICCSAVCIGNLLFQLVGILTEKNRRSRLIKYKSKSFALISYSLP